MPELPDAMRARLVATYGADRLRRGAADRRRATLADYFEDACAALHAARRRCAKLVANWMIGELSAALNARDCAIADAPVAAARRSPRCCGASPTARSPARWRKEVFDAMWTRRRAIGAIDAESSTRSSTARPAADLRRGRDRSDRRRRARREPAIVAEFRAGKEKAFNALVGKVMKATKGKANPAQVNAIASKREALGLAIQCSGLYRGRCGRAPSSPRRFVLSASYSW